jgi:TonB family protein
MPQNALLDGVLLDHPNALRRLLDECAEAVRELREDPRGYLRSILNHTPGFGRQRTLMRMGLSLALLLYAVGFAVTLLLWTAHQHNSLAAGQDPVYVGHKLNPIIPLLVNKGEDSGDAGGGGGGGRHEETPPSSGQAAIFQLDPPIVSPVPEPQLKAPSIPMTEAIRADPRLQPQRDEMSPTGLPDSIPSPPSAGPGSDGGVGTGSGGALGSGRGPGYGEGSGGNTGGGDRSIGYPGRSSSLQPAVDSKPRLLNNPRPLYTEEARKNKVQGSVKVRLQVGADGLVKEVAVISPLPFGLTEQAIQAAYQMRFTPAMKDGRAIPYWLTNVVIEFNLR